VIVVVDSSGASGAVGAVLVDVSVAVIVASAASGAVVEVLVEVSVADVVSEEVAAVSSVDVEVASTCAKAGLTMTIAAASTKTKTLNPANATVLLFMNKNIVPYRDKPGLVLLWILSRA
jgi:hypothetical protein